MSARAGIAWPQTRAESGGALVSALVTLALAGLAAAALANLGRTALAQARLDRDGARAWFLAEAGLADTVAAIAPGRDFTHLLAGPAADAAIPPTPWSYTASFRDDTDDLPDDPTVDANTRVLLRMTAAGPAPVRRRLEAVLGRAADPFFPGAVSLAGPARHLGADLVLDGHDFAMAGDCAARGAGPDKTGLVLPEGVAPPALTRPDRITGRGADPSIAWRAPPDLTPLAAAPGAAHHPAGEVAGDLGSAAAPRFTIVDGDAVVVENTSGAGVLYVTGRLRIDGRLAFTGVVAAAGGVELSGSGEIAVCGALWAAGDRALEARGRGSVRASTEAIRRAAHLSPLPASVRVIAVRELF